MTKQPTLRSKGFTIVELLIIVTVIAILATIVIVSYRGVIDRSKAASAKSLANEVIEKLELYRTYKGAYPVSVSDFSEYQDTKVDAGTVVPYSPTEPTDEKEVAYTYCVVSGVNTGATITYRTFPTGKAFIIRGTCS